MTKPIRAKISALGTYLPPRLLTNADLEKMVDTTDEWIVERVGIRERHIAEKGVAASDLAVWPHGGSRPVASDLNFAAGQTVPNLVIVKLSSAGKIDIGNDFGSTDVIVDVVGWYG